MANVYDTIALGILAMLKANCGAAFTSYSRGALLYDDVIQRIQGSGGPAMTFPQLWYYEGVGLGGGTVAYERTARGLPPKRVISHTIIIYALKPKANTPDGADVTVAGNTVINPLLASVEQAFIPDRENAVTLGGLVSHAWIEGEAIAVPGDIDPSGLAMQTVPVKILIP